MESFPSLLLLLIIGRLLIPLGRVSISALPIYSPDGDVIDCINGANQPALGHPLLKNHQLQEFPTGMPKKGKDAEKIRQVWHETGEVCPAGTIPIRRELGDSNVSNKKHSPNAPDLANTATSGHKYAIGYRKNQQTKIYGTRATLNVWDPIVEGFGDFSLAQIWVASGSYDSADLNTIEAGWQVYPSKYFDNQPRLFTYWTTNAYNGTGCYGIECAGFVQTSSSIAIGAAISRTSTSGSTQLDITIQIWKDPLSGNWWLGLGHNTVPIGYWPAAIFTVLSDHAISVQWGGEVLYKNFTGVNTKAQMGSGEFANKGYRKAAYFCNLRVAEDNHSLLPVQDFNVLADYPKYFTIKKWHNTEYGNHFYYGGPGPLRLVAVRETLSSAYLVVYFDLVSRAGPWHMPIKHLLVLLKYILKFRPYYTKNSLSLVVIVIPWIVS